MLIISRLLIKQWFKSLLGAVLVLFLLITATDLINGFLQGKNFSRVILEYSLKMPDLMGKMFPICSLVATLFSLNALKAHSELIAILSTGYSYLKIYFLIASCAIFMVLFQFLNLGFVEPFANKIKRQEISKSRASEGRYLTRSSLEGGKFWYKSKSYFASFDFFNKTERSLNNVEIYFFNDSNTSTRILRAEKATYVDQGKWSLIKVTDLLDLNGQTFPIHTIKESMEISLLEVPDDFGEFEADLTTLSFFKLQEFISKLSKTGLNINEYRIILLNKIFLSFICLVFALFPVSTIFTPNRRSSSFGKNVVLTLLVTVVFWVLYSSSVALGNSGKLPPLIATGIIPILFFSYVIWAFFKNRKLAI